tara:strand:- start:1112 stop:1531 length:420 start_codon:yes stop_codon:yes gene_type:complete
MDIDLLAQALENDENMSVINTSIQELKKKKNDILQQLGLKRDDLKSYNKKLKNYRYIENIKDLKYGCVLRCINLNNIEIIKLYNSSILCDIQIHDKGIALIMKTFNHRFITLYFNENLFFQKISAEEEVILKAINYLSK